MEPLSIAVVQLRSNENIAQNEQQILQQIESLGDLNQIDLVALPENSLYLQISPYDSKTRQIFSLRESIFQKLNYLAVNHDVTFLLGSVPVKEGEQVFNATVRVGPTNDIKVVYRKVHLFDVDVKGEKPICESDQFAHGSGPEIINIKGWKLGLSICYDLRFSELYSSYAKEGVHLILVPSAFLVTTGKAHWEPLLRARAIENQAFVLAPAQGGTHLAESGSSRETYGHSMIVDPWGQVIGELEQPGPGTLKATLDPKLIEKVRRQIPMSNHRRVHK